MLFSWLDPIIKISNFVCIYSKWCSFQDFLKMDIFLIVLKSDCSEIHCIISWEILEIYMLGIISSIVKGKKNSILFTENRTFHTYFPMILTCFNKQVTILQKPFNMFLSGSNGSLESEIISVIRCMNINCTLLLLTAVFSFLNFQA